MFDDEKLTVFHGGKDKTAARTMLEAVPDRKSFTTRIENDAGQGVTRMLRTRGGRPEVTTVGQGGEKEKGVGIIAKFFATPTSKDYPDGYVSDPGYIGPFSDWRRWPGKTNPPVAESTGGVDRLAPFAPLSSDIPGTITWFSDAFMLGSNHIVLSWRGNNLRHGVYGAKDGAKSIDEWQDKPSNKTEFNFGADCHGRSADFRSRVWLSDTIWVNTGVFVWSAGLRKIGSETYLYVISQYGIYRAPLKVTSFEGSKRLNKRIHDSTLVMESVASFSGEVPHLSQMPFINASCTKAVLFVSSKEVSDTPLGEGETAPWSIAEVTLDSGAVSPVFTNQYTAGTPNVAAGLVGANVSISESPHELLRRETAWAADYKGDVLVYLFARHTILNGGRVFASTISGVSPAAYNSYTNVRGVLSDSYEVVHSTLGSLLKEFVANPGVITNSFSSSTENGTSETTSSTTSVSGDVHSVRIGSDLLVNADLRHDLFIFTYQKDDFLTTGDFSSTTSGGGVSYVTQNELWVATTIYKILKGPGVLYEVEHPTGDGGSYYPGSAGPVIPWNPYSVWGGSLSYPPTFTEYESGSYSFRSDYVGGENEWVCADVAHMAVSPDGKAAYVALNWPTTDTETGVDVMLFVLEGVTTLVPSSTYCPGSASCLAGAIFYPKILDDL